MEGDATQLGPGGTRKPQYQLTRKRRHNAESGESIFKSPRLQGKVQSQPSRTSPRLRERHNLNQQLAGKPARSSPRTTKACRGSKQEERPRPDYESPTAQVVHDNQPSSGRKRQRTETEEEQPALATPSPLPPWKRVKRPF